MFLLLACTGAPEPTDDTAAPDTFSSLADAPLDDRADPVFDPDAIGTIALEMDPEDWAAVRGDPELQAWRHADFTWNGETVANVGVRPFGLQGLAPGKPSLKIGFDYYGDGQQFRGLDELKLDASAQDAGFQNEYLVAAALRRADVPAPRTGWARVTVNGEDAGFYVVLESVDDRFVRRWFGNDDGALYQPRKDRPGQGLNPMTDALAWYEPQTSVGGDGSDLVAIADLVASGTDAELAAAVDVDGYARLAVLRSVLGGFDSFVSAGTNDYLYDDGGVWRFAGWDFDLDLGAAYFGPSLQSDIAAPWLASPYAINADTGAAYTDPLLERLLDGGLDVDALVAELLAGPLDWATMDAAAEAAAILVRDEVRTDPLDVGDAFDRRRYDLRLWLHSRLSALAGRDVADCEPLDGTPIADLSPSATVGWDTLRVDETTLGPGYNVAGEHYCTGAWAPAPSQLALTVPAGASTLSGRAGLQDFVEACGDGVVFSIVQDGATLWSSGTLENYDRAESFEVAVAPGEVRLVANDGADSDCDNAVWVDVAAR